MKTAIITMLLIFWSALFGFSSNKDTNLFYILDLEQTLIEDSKIVEISPQNIVHSLWSIEIVLHDHQTPWSDGSKNADFEIHISLRDYPEFLENVFDQERAFFAYAIDRTKKIVSGQPYEVFFCYVK